MSKSQLTRFHKTVLMLTEVVSAALPLLRAQNVCVLALIFFFFYWHYNPLWVLAFSVIFFHSTLSSHNFLHPLIPIICIYSSMSSIHLFLGLPLFLLPVGFHCSTLLGILFPSIHITRPSQAILLLFTNLTISAFLLGHSARNLF